MKLLIFLAVILITGAAFAQDAPGFPSLPESPVQLLQTLKSSNIVHTVRGSKPGYVQEADIPHLIALLDSKEPCAHINIAASSILPTERSTVGHQAAYLIEGFWKRYYPTDLTSARYTPNIAEIKQWFKVWTHVKDSAKAGSPER